MVRLPQRPTPETMTKFMAKLLGSPAASELLVPDSLNTSVIGGESEVIQALVTWARRFPNPVLRMYHPESALSADSFTSTHVLAAVILARHVLDLQGEDITSLARMHVQRRLTELSKSTMIGRSAPLVAADHTSEARPDSLYRVVRRHAGLSREVKDAGAFGEVVRNSIRAMNVGELAAHAVSSRATEIGWVLRELFDNTDRHARTNSDQITPLRPSIRMILMRDVQLPLAVLERGLDKATALPAYLAHGAHLGGFEGGQGKEMRRFAHISVLDSGIGLPDRARSEGTSFGSDVDAVIWCLRRYATRGSTSGRGRGLNEVQRLLSDLDGYLQIRTGAVRFERDFVASPFHELDEDRVVRQGAWQIASNLPPVSGTAVSFIVPTIFKTR